MNDQKINISKIAPVLMAFFVMSFVDLVGVGVDHVVQDMHKSSTLAQMITLVAFTWFFLLSVPVGVLQSKIGKKNMLIIGIGITALGMLVPFMFYEYATVLVGFSLLGIGNTIVQVSANPLMVEVVPGNRASSFLSFSQFVKAIGSMIAPFLAVKFALWFGDWKILFLVFGAVSIISGIWLGSVKIDEKKELQEKATFMSSLKLLGTSFVLLMVLSIFLVVGIDVGFNSNSGQFLIKKFGVDPDTAIQGRTIYFIGRMIGTFAGAIILTKLSSRKFFMWTSVLGLLALIAILLVKSTVLAWGLIFMIGLAVANIWPLVFSIAVERYPSRNNEISGLMMMAISGGAVIPLLIGWLSDLMSITLGMSVLAACMVYLLAVSFYCLRQKEEFIPAKEVI